MRTLQQSRLRYALVGGAALLVFAVGTLLLGEDTSHSSESGASLAQEVSLGDVRFQPLERTIEVVGTLYGTEESTISAKVPGRLQQNLVDIGDRVRPLQELALIERTEYQLAVDERKTALAETAARLGLTGVPPESFDPTTVATVQRAKAEAANARVKMERASKLLDAVPPLISAQDFADLETAYQVAQRDYEVAILEAKSLLALVRTRATEVKVAEQKLSDTSVRAPLPPPRFDPAQVQYGVATRLRAPGEYVREGDPLFRLVLDHPVKLRASVPERHVGAVQLGQPVTIQVDSYTDTFTGSISRISPAISAESRTFEIEAVVPNKEGRLRAGAFARGLIRVGEDTGLPWVPKEAVVSFAGVQRVFSVKDGKAVEHLIESGPERDGYVAVLKGLKDVRSVVTSGAGRLNDTRAVTVR